MTRRQDLRRLLWPAAAVAGGAALAGVVLHHTHGLLDLAVYRYGGRAVLDGVPLYLGADPVTDLPFTYPPFAALLFAPLALVPGVASAAAWTAVSGLALLAVVLLARTTVGRGGRAGDHHETSVGRGATPQPAGSWPTVGLAAALVTLEPVWQTFSFGQVNLVLMLLAVVDLLLPDRRWAGVLVGVAAGIKLTPLVFVVLLVLVGRRVAAGRAVVAFLATIAVGFAVLPATAWTYWTDALRDPARVGGPAYSGNQSVYGELTRLLDGPPPTLLWLAVAGTAALGILLVAARVWRTGDRVLGVALGGIAMLVGSPISWSHHWVWAALVALALLRRSWRWALVWSAVFVAAPVWWLPHGEDAELAWGPVDHVLGNAYLIAALLLAGWAARDVRRARGAAPAATPRAPDVTVVEGAGSQR